MAANSSLRDPILPVGAGDSGAEIVSAAEAPKKPLETAPRATKKPARETRDDRIAIVTGVGPTPGPEETGAAGLAQLVEHVICNHGVTGSNPVAGTST